MNCSMLWNPFSITSLLPVRSYAAVSYTHLDVYKRQDEHTLTTSISRIRSKIESDGGAPYIKTVYGMGYQWTGGEAK